MLRSKSKSLGNHVVSPAKEKGKGSRKDLQKGNSKVWNERESG